MRPITPGSYRRIVAFAVASLALIVLTGAAVRLTEAGLGCEDWPACSEDRLVPELALHPWIEFGNRLFSGIVALAVIAAALNAYRRQPRRARLVNLSWGLVVGVAAQVVLGGITVRVDLHPASVGLHFLLSMVLLWNGVTLWVEADREDDDVSTPLALAPRLGPVPVPLGAVGHGRLMVALATLVLVTGTLVTGAGPNGGDSRAERLDFDLWAITRVHSIAVWSFVAVAVALVVRIAMATDRPSERSAPLTRSPLATGRLLLAVAVAQGAVGYWQFATGVPPLLVGLHVAGATIVWCTTVLLHLQVARSAPPHRVGDDRQRLAMTGGADDRYTDTASMPGA